MCGSTNVWLEDSLYRGNEDQSSGGWTCRIFHDLTEKGLLAGQVLLWAAWR